MKVSTKKVKYNATEDATGQAENNSTSAEVTWDADPSGSGVDTSEPVRSKSESVEQDVDRLIDADSNEYVLSRPKGGVALTLDPLLIQVRRRLACALHAAIDEASGLALHACMSTMHSCAA